MCIDVAAKRGTECNTDHNLVCAKVQLNRSPFGKAAKKAKNKRYNVERLTAGAGGNEKITYKDNYLQAAMEKASSDWREEASVDDKWSALKSGLANAAEEVLGEAGRHQPDWFWESMPSLKPVLAARNAAYSRWLVSGRQVDL